MLKDFLVDFTKQYHELGHENLLFFDGIENSDAVNDMIDSVSGLGHRIKFGHDFEGFSEAFEIDGIHGITSWFDHMLKDFTSHDGVPLPGADFVEGVTGMGYQDAVDWLSINASDVIELGLSHQAFALVKNRYNDNPKMKAAVQVISGVVAISDDNLPLVGYLAVKTASDLNRKYKIVSEETTKKLQDSSGKVLNTAGKVCVATFITGVGTELVLNESVTEVATTIFSTGGEMAANLVDNVGLMPDLAIDGGDFADWAGDLADLVDGAATFGLGIVLTQMVKGAFNIFNESQRKAVIYLLNRKQQRKEMQKLSAMEIPPGLIAERIKALDRVLPYIGLLPPPKGNG